MDVTDRGDMTDFHSQLADERTSPLDKYSDMAVGDRGLCPLLRYELLTGLFGGMPGAAGYLLREKAYRGLLGACGRGVVFGRGISLRCPGRMRIGESSLFDDGCVLDAKGGSERGISIGDGVVIGRHTSLSCKGGSIEIGDHANISGNCMLISESTLSIGSNVLVAGMTYIIAGGNHGTDRTDIPIIRQPVFSRGGVTIEDNAWIGANVTILDGVRIGRDSIIGAGSVVTRSIPEYSIAVGVPARVIKSRRQDGE